MILTFRHRGDSRGNQKYAGDVNIALSGGFPSSILNAKVKGAITNTLEFLLNPVNCVLAGQQPDEKKYPQFVTDPYGILKKIIFGE